MKRLLTQAEYARVLNEENSDFCDCCGGKYEIAGLHEAQMPDLERPEIISGMTAYPLLGGFHACSACVEHCEEGPCQPDDLMEISDEAEEAIRHDELAREAQRELDIQQTFPSSFSSYGAYEEWREAND